jgi:hypothetical protein
MVVIARVVNVARGRSETLSALVIKAWAVEGREVIGNQVQARVRGGACDALPAVLWALPTKL